MSGVQQLWIPPHPPKSPSDPAQTLAVALQSEKQVWHNYRMSCQRLARSLIRPIILKKAWHHWTSLPEFLREPEGNIFSEIRLLWAILQIKQTGPYSMSTGMQAFAHYGIKKNSHCNSQVPLNLIDSWLKGLQRMNKKYLNENQVNVWNRLLWCVCWENLIYPTSGGTARRKDLKCCLHSVQPTNTNTHRYSWLFKIPQESVQGCTEVRLKQAKKKD